MTTVAETPARSARHGFDSLEEETHIEGLPVRVPCRRGFRARCSAPARRSGRSASAR